MNTEHLIIKARTVSARLQNTKPGAARRLRRLADRLERLRLAQHKLNRAKQPS